MSAEIRTAFQVPFSVVHPETAFFSSGQPLAVHIQLHPGAHASAVDRIFKTIGGFADLASTGALAGARIRPDRCELRLDSDPMIRGDDLTFEFSRCLLDDRGLIVLCDLLLHKDLVEPIRSLSVLRSAVDRYSRLQSDSYSTYPDAYQDLPFPTSDEEPESGSYSFSITLQRPLDTENRQYLQLAFSTWKYAVLRGAFALAPIPPEDNYVEPDDPFVDFDETIEWTVFKLRAHSACISAIKNILGAFHYRCQQLSSLTIT